MDSFDGLLKNTQKINELEDHEDVLVLIDVLKTSLARLIQYAKKQELVGAAREEAKTIAREAQELLQLLEKPEVGK